MLLRILNACIPAFAVYQFNRFAVPARFCVMMSKSPRNRRNQGI